MHGQIDIAIVDDDRDDREIFVEAAEAINPSIHCYEFSGGEGLLNFLQTVKNNISFIALDINMPRLNGWQILEILKSTAATRGIPVMICSTTMKTVDVERALSMGAHSVVIKPDNFEAWKNILSATLEKIAVLGN